MKIALVAACDRNNYGDILLPILLEREVKNKFANAYVLYYGLKKADLRKVKGRKVLPLYKIDKNIDIVIIAGGEVIGGNYTTMFMYFQDNIICKFVIRFFNHFFENFTNKISKMFLHGKMSYPWLVFPCSEEQKVFYNSVGCISADKFSELGKKEFKDVIAKSSLFSVRDKKSFKVALSLAEEKDVLLVPDTAILMEYYYPKTILKNYVSEYVRNMELAERKYFVLQVNNFFGKGLESKIAEAINKIFNELGLICVLLPMGRAAFHEDQIPLKKIGKLSGCKSSILVKKNTIFDTMYIISKSIAYIGTSLHGAITAASYYVSHTVLLKSAKKSTGFIDTWKTSEKYYIENTEDFCEFIKNCSLENEYMVNRNNINIAKDLVKNYYRKMEEKINEHLNH